MISHDHLELRTRQEIEQCSQCKQDLGTDPLHCPKFDITGVSGKVNIENGQLLLKVGQLSPGYLVDAIESLPRACSSQQLECYWRKR